MRKWLKALGWRHLLSLFIHVFKYYANNNLLLTEFFRYQFNVIGEIVLYDRWQRVFVVLLGEWLYGFIMSFIGNVLMFCYSCCYINLLYLL